MASNTDFLLALENVSVAFDGFKAVNGLNLYIDKGELRVIIGPNGAGKTTVLDLICGRTKVSEGSIKFKDQEITGCKERQIAAMTFRAEHLDRSAQTLSHGQKQWLEIGMLLIQDPELLMLDEPVAGMSVSERAKTAELLNRIIKGRSVLVIEHDMKFVEDIAHKVTVLHQGQILSEGTMEHVKNDPKVIEVYLGH